MSNGLDGQGIRVQFPSKARYFSLLRSVQAGPMAHVATYAIGMGDFFPGGKAVECEVDKLPASNAHVKTDGSISPLHHTSS
jgi:hypothetical protein